MILYPRTFSGVGLVFTCAGSAMPRAMLPAFLSTVWTVVIELGFEPADKITIFRVPGAWEADAFKILDKYGIEYCDRSVSISEAARRAVAKVKPG